MTLCVIDQENPRDLENNLLCCRVCAGRLAGALRQIPKLVDEVRSLGLVWRDTREGTRAELLGGEVVRVPGMADPVANLVPAGPVAGGWRESRIRSTRPERVPISLDASDLTAPARAGSVGVKHRGSWFGKPDGDPDQVGHLSVATVLDAHVRQWAEERGEGLPALRTARERSPVGLLARWLTDRLPWALQSLDGEALREFAVDVSDLLGALFGQAYGGRVRPKPMEADCPRCHLATLIQATPEDNIECVSPDCLRVLTPEEYADYVRDLIEEAS